MYLYILYMLLCICYHMIIHFAVFHLGLHTANPPAHSILPETLVLWIHNVPQLCTANSINSAFTHTSRPEHHLKLTEGCTLKSYQQLPSSPSFLTRTNSSLHHYTTLGFKKCPTCCCALCCPDPHLHGMDLQYLSSLDIAAPSALQQPCPC